MDSIIKIYGGSPVFFLDVERRVAFFFAENIVRLHPRRVPGGICTEVSPGFISGSNDFSFVVLQSFFIIFPFAVPELRIQCFEEGVSSLMDSLLQFIQALIPTVNLSGSFVGVL